MEVIIKLSIVFVLIIVALRFKVQLGIALILSAIGMGFLFSVELLAIAKSLFRVVFRKSMTIELIVILYLIPIIEKTMRTSGVFDRMIGSIKSIIKDTRITSVFFPILLGMLPSVGGARFSAPLCDEVSKNMENFSSKRKSLVNYWFRHIWEPVFPLYPGLILTAALSGIWISSIIRYQIPYAVLMIIIGWVVCFYGIPKHIESSENIDIRKSIMPLVEGLAPILFLIIAVLFIKISLILALVVVIGWLFIFYRFSLKNILKYMKEAIDIKVILLIVGIVYFQDMLNVSDAISKLKVFFESSHVNTRIILFFLPFIVGILTGFVQGFVAVVFPLVLPLITFNGVISLPLLSFFYISGYAGVLLSPMHVCYSITCEYFKVDISKLYPYLLVMVPFLPIMSYIFTLFR